MKLIALIYLKQWISGYFISFSVSKPFCQKLSLLCFLCICYILTKNSIYWFWYGIEKWGFLSIRWLHINLKYKHKRGFCLVVWLVFPL